jgi:hypothetical protein
MKVLFNKSQFEIINENIKTIPKSINLLKLNDLKYQMDLNLDDADYLLDKLSDLLIEKGLNSNDEPNSLGLKIESIIDIVNRVKYP